MWKNFQQKFIPDFASKNSYRGKAI
ncbi:hypothetical protein LEMLEM_LOCUS21487 [Lemmus lemmus]